MLKTKVGMEFTIPYKITALIASLLHWEGKQAIISSQEGKQAIKLKEGIIK